MVSWSPTQRVCVGPRIWLPPSSQETPVLGAGWGRHPDSLGPPCSPSARPFPAAGRSASGVSRLIYSTVLCIIGLGVLEVKANLNGWI